MALAHLKHNLPLIGFCELDLFQWKAFRHQLDEMRSRGEQVYITYESDGWLKRSFTIIGDYSSMMEVTNYLRSLSRSRQLIRALNAGHKDVLTERHM